MSAAGPALPDGYLNKCHFGDVRAVLGQMIRDGVKVQTIVTSPPYWGLRSYLPDDHPSKALELGSEPTLQAFIATMVDVFNLAREVLADDGTLWMNMGDAYAGSWGAQSMHDGQSASALRDRTLAGAQRRDSGAGSLSRTPGLKPKDLMGQPWRLALALQDAGWWLRQDVIWAKPNPMPESIRDRFTKSHEYLFLLTKSEHYQWDFAAAQEPVSGGSHPRKAGNGVGFGHGFDDKTKPRWIGVDMASQPDETVFLERKPSGWASGTGRRHDEVVGRYPATAIEQGAAADGAGERMGRGPGWRVKANERWNESTGAIVEKRNRRSVWTIPTQAFRGAHFATFPEALVEPCILIGTKPGQTVLDIFFGSGTTGQVAERLGRNWMGIDLNDSYEPLQRGRTAQRGLILEAPDA